MNKLIIMAALVAVSLSSPAQAITGNKLKAYCDDDADVADRGFCNGYVLGVDSGIIVAGLAHNKSRDICVPPEVTTGQMVAIMKKWMNNNPELLHNEAVYLVWNVLAQAFPCDNEDRP